jgi:phage anti-repressor protein
MAIDKIAKIAKKYECIKCNYNTSNKYDYDKHLTTAKHYRLTNTNEKSQKIAKVYICDCGKEYKHASSLFKHRKKCTYITEEKPPENTIVLTTEEPNTNENSIDYKNMFIELMKRYDELHQTIKEMVPRIGNNNTTNSNSNNTFNVMLYLNDHCKDAISIEQFMNDIVVTDDDIVSMSKNKKPADNFANLIMKSLKNFDVTKRPLHCTDERRGTLYIKHDEGWDYDKKKERDEAEIKEMEKWKKTDTKDPIIPKAMKRTLNVKPFCAIRTYKQSHPNSAVEDTAEYIMTGKALQNSQVDCADTEELDTITQKITKQLCSNVRLDKNATA